MENLQLNVVYIGAPTFPIGPATTKRRRYMVDYMNNHGIENHVLVCGHAVSKTFKNEQHGFYGETEYVNVSQWAVSKNYLKFYKEGLSYLKKWFSFGKKNVLIFTTTLQPLHYLFYQYGKKLGYKIVFDQVETSLSKSGKLTKLAQINIAVSDFISRSAYKKSASFVISSALWKQNIALKKDMKLCILPNSTPSFCDQKKQELHKPLRVLYSGTFGPKDGVAYLIDGAIQAKVKGANLELILIGKGFDWDMKVLDKTKGMDWVHYLGFVTDEELEYQIKNSDVLCMTRTNSLFANYGFPFKLSEYLATGNILLATNVGDVCKYVSHKENAYIVKPEDSSEIADTLLHIEKNPDEAIRIANNGYKAMEDNFSIDKVGSTFINFLKLI